jgi:hypothetical protein
MSPRHRFTALAAAALVMFILASTSAVSDSASPKPSPWDRMRFFVGSWSGTGHGQPGTSTVEREYAFALHERFIEVRNTSTYAPQEKNPKGEVHEDHGFISWDRARHRFVFRQFHVEGFVNQYVADSLGADASTIVFISEGLENIPPGYRARETYRILGPDEFSERFELAEPESTFKVYSEVTLKRKK